MVDKQNFREHMQPLAYPGGGGGIGQLPSVWKGRETFLTAFRPN